MISCNFQNQDKYRELGIPSTYLDENTQKLNKFLHEFYANLGVCTCMSNYFRP